MKLDRIIEKNPRILSDIFKTMSDVYTDKGEKKSPGDLTQEIARMVSGNTVASRLADKGRRGDDRLAHVNPQEARILKMMGGSGTINPKTGLREYFWDDGDGWDWGSFSTDDAGATGAATTGGEDDITDAGDPYGFYGDFTRGVTENDPDGPLAGETFTSTNMPGVTSYGLERDELPAGYQFEDPLTGEVFDTGGDTLGDPNFFVTPERGTLMGDMFFGLNQPPSSLVSPTAAALFNLASGAGDLIGGALGRGFGNRPTSAPVDELDEPVDVSVTGETPFQGGRDVDQLAFPETVDEFFTSDPITSFTEPFDPDLEDTTQAAQGGSPMVARPPVIQDDFVPTEITDFLGATGSPLQMRSQLATRALFGDERTDPLIRLYKQLAENYFRRPGGGTFEDREILPIDQMFVTDILGGERPMNVQQLLGALA
jgi:hypothetical protein